MNHEDTFNKYYKQLDFPQPGIVACGRIASNGTFISPYFALPSRISLQRTGTGVYLLTHNLGTVSYILHATPINSLMSSAIQNPTSSSCSIIFSGDTDFYFTLFQI